MNKNEIALYESSDGVIKLEVETDGETVWLNRNQIAALFDRDVKTIGKHINNALREEFEEAHSSVVAKFATTADDGKVYQVEYYQLDMILSVGYRVKSKRGVEFRRWANKVLKDYIINGYALNKKRLAQLEKMVEIMKRADAQLDAGHVLGVIESYARALNLLDNYDHQAVNKPKGSPSVYELTYEDAKEIIAQMSYGAESSLFGKEKDDSFRGALGAVYQTFGGEDLYPTTEEKAARLLYFITKDHCFVDGNKRIAAALFLCFLDKNQCLIKEGKKVIEDHTLVALVIMIAESRPAEKEIIINLTMQFLQA